MAHLNPPPELDRQLERLIYELLDAHDDTAGLLSALPREPRIEAHLAYLRALQRIGREALARGASSHFPDAGRSASHDTPAPPVDACVLRCQGRDRQPGLRIGECAALRFRRGQTAADGDGPPAGITLVAIVAAGAFGPATRVHPRGDLDASVAAALTTLAAAARRW